MDKESSISDRVKSSIEEQKDDIPVKDYRFYQVDKLVRLVEMLEKESECKQCRTYLIALEPFLNDIKSVMEDKARRVELEKLTDLSVKHMRREHKYYLSRYFNYTYSFIGMLIGLAGGTLLAYLRDYPSKLIIILSAWFIGLVIGRLTGSLKDKNIKNQGKQI